MDNAFDVDKHIARIGARLVQEFDEARAATSPTAVGDAMESPVSPNPPKGWRYSSRMGDEWQRGRWFGQDFG